MRNLLKQNYYYLKPFMPLQLNLALRRKYLRYQLGRYSDVWPINPEVGNPPPEWQGWPDGKQFALVLTHDIEGGAGQKKCYPLIELEKQLKYAGIRYIRTGFGQGYPISGEYLSNVFW